MKALDSETKFLAREPGEFGYTVEQEKEFWSKGIGKIMMQECINWCKGKGLEQLELEVVTENTHAVSMYKNLGFEVCGTKKHALKYEKLVGKFELRKLLMEAEEDIRDGRVTDLDEAFKNIRESY